MNFYKHHIGDYIKATSHLSLLEHGCYRRMLDVYYAKERPFPDDIDAICRLVGAVALAEKKIIGALLQEFFIYSVNCWNNRRADEEIAAYQAQCKVNQEVGKLGGRPRKNRIGFEK